jgi:hypothetical protein
MIVFAWIGFVSGALSLAIQIVAAYRRHKEPVDYPKALTGGRRVGPVSPLIRACSCEHPFCFYCSPSLRHSQRRDVP